MAHVEPRPLLAAVQEAQFALALPGEETRERALLRELVDWASTNPSPQERGRIVATGADPANYVAIPCIVQVNPSVAGVITMANTPQGPKEVAIFQFFCAIPMEHFNVKKVSRLLGSKGEAMNPADGMIGMLDARFVIPRERITPAVLAALGRPVLNGGVVDRAPSNEEA